MKKLCWTATAIPFLLAGCNAPDASTPPAEEHAPAAEAVTNAGETPAATRAAADLKTADGAEAGKATARKSRVQGRRLSVREDRGGGSIYNTKKQHSHL